MITKQEIENIVARYENFEIDNVVDELYKLMNKDQ